MVFLLTADDIDMHRMRFLLPIVPIVSYLGCIQLKAIYLFDFLSADGVQLDGCVHVVQAHRGIDFVSHFGP